MKMRTKAITLLTAALLLTTVIVLPRIIEAKRLNAADKTLTVQPLVTTSVSPNQKGGDVTVGTSVHNDTSAPLRDMKPAKVGKKIEREANENPKIPNAVNHKN